MTRLLAALVVVLAVLALGMPSAGAAADAGAEAEFVDRINGARGGAGKGVLATDGELTAIARRWSQRMANEQRLSHNPNLANEVKADWEKLAENVGFGQNVGQIHEAFMNSAAHRNNILDGAMTHVGVGVVVDGSGQMWVTEVFMRLRGGGAPPTTAAPPPPPPPPPSTTARPVPPPTSPPTTRAPRVTRPTTARPAPPVTQAPAPDPAAEAAASAAAAEAAAAAAAAEAAASAAAQQAAAAAAAAARTPTPRLILVLDGLRSLDQGR